MDFYLINAEPLARACKTGMCGGKIIKGSLVRRMLRNYSLGLDCLLLKLERKFLPSPTSTADVEAMCGNVGLERELESVWRDSAYKNGRKSCYGRNALLLALSVPRGALNLNQKPIFMNNSRNRHD